MGNRNQKKGIRSIAFSVAFLLTLVILTYYLLFRKFDIHEIFSVIGESNGLYIILGFAMIFIYLLCYALFAKTFLASRGYRFGIFRGFVYAATDFYFSAITPSATGGQPMVIYYMSKDGVPVSEGFLSTFLHTITFQVVLLLLNLFSLCLYWKIWADSGWLFITLWFIGLFLTLGVITLTLLSMFKRDAARKIGNGFIKFLGRLRLLRHPEKTKEKFSSSLDDYQRAAQELLNQKKLYIKLFGVVFAQRIAYFSVAFIIYCSLGNAGYGYFYFLAVQVFIALAVDSLPFPGGMGANEAAIITMYTSVFGAEKAAGAMILIRFVNYYSGLIIASVVTISNHLYHSFINKRVVK